MDDYRYKVIVDPIHGDIGLTKLETDLLNTPSFQRLRRIKQLGFASIVYPNANHTRFGHSLGALYIMGRVCTLFQNKRKLKDDEVKILRIAALLHDIGHYPYSHLMEFLEWDQYEDTLIAEKNANSTPQSLEAIKPFEPYPKHEQLGSLIIEHRNDVKQLLENNDINPAEISAIISGSHTALPNFLHYSLDIDRIDYLMRDSLNTGVPYGRIDGNYILNNLDITDNREVVIKPKAKAAAEHLLVARYFMFKNVYFHKTIQAFEGMLRNFLMLLHREDKLYKSGKDIKDIVSTNSEEFLRFDDSYIDRFVDEYTHNGLSGTMEILAKAIKLRKRPKLVHEIAYLSGSKDNARFEEFTFFTALKSRLLTKLKEQFGIPEPLWIWEDSKGIRFEKMDPFVSISKAQDIESAEVRELIQVKETDGRITKLIEDQNSVAYHLSQLKQTLVRLYVVEENEQKIAAIKSQVTAWITTRKIA
jgi:HD superfamily phosphohydrolase